MNNSFQAMMLLGLGHAHAEVSSTPLGFRPLAFCPLSETSKNKSISKLEFKLKKGSRGETKSSSDIVSTAITTLETKLLVEQTIEGIYGIDSQS